MRNIIPFDLSFKRRRAGEENLPLRSELLPRSKSGYLDFVIRKIMPSWFSFKPPKYEVSLFLLVNGKAKQILYETAAPEGVAHLWAMAGAVAKARNLQFDFHNDTGDPDTDFRILAENTTLSDSPTPPAAA